MPEERQFYEPQSDAAKIAMKGGVLGAMLGTVIVGMEGLTLAVEVVRDLPMQETAINIVQAAGFTALNVLMATKAPRHIDQLIYRQTD